MSTLLHVAASPRGALSNSYRLGCELVVRLGRAYPGLRQVERHLGATPPPAPDAQFAAQTLMPPEQRHGDTWSQTLIAELEQAHLVVLSTPMHNFTVPTALKGWIDQVVRPGRTFESTAHGKRGLLQAKPVFAIVSCGGPVGEAAYAQQDFLTPYLRYVLASIGLSDVRMAVLDGFNRSEAQALQSYRRGLAWIDAQAAQLGLGAPPGTPPAAV